jgi:four helix bundle protein
MANNRKYQRFEALPVWQAAIEPGVRIFTLSATGCFQGQSGLRDQIERAAVSISSNIAEGFERGTHEELLTFLYIARGSAGEARSLLVLMERIPGFEERRSELADLRSLVLDISRQLGAWIESLKNIDHKGPRYQTDAKRHAAREVRRRDAFMEKLQRLVEEGKMNEEKMNEQEDQQE